MVKIGAYEAIEAIQRAVVMAVEEYPPRLECLRRNEDLNRVADNEQVIFERLKFIIDSNILYKLMVDYAGQSFKKNNPI